MGIPCSFFCLLPHIHGRNSTYVAGYCTECWIKVLLFFVADKLITTRSINPSLLCTHTIFTCSGVWCFPAIPFTPLKNANTIWHYGNYIFMRFCQLPLQEWLNLIHLFIIVYLHIALDGVWLGFRLYKVGSQCTGNRKEVLWSKKTTNFWLVGEMWWIV